mmetsp:Transcript_82066/g.254774  ORF Transcript_82066/g.254774 Transcript_82066/m.254774 type:complete len:221 (-) Transcript_82066:166-828(-)|eukprot:CAMPEP_0204589878 /NCGR_PEP_ID=MMETSP0661-20131031/49458_1 /ASSEMBLY_ACC=CAM_ASM_000606 /TAXON_ID=109239 /ORGANISM="Alexandrium margalefi, Strain AMGDE01CS-322" /LENGTH=220 /DNA_ID=CAMNT_0051599841 /DNA_START=81 /DNA_END=743 /DNA_ORIENTATION=+
MYAMSRRGLILFVLALFGSVLTSFAKEKAIDPCLANKGLFADATLDAVIPLCDGNYPDTTSKDTWLVLLYTQDQNTEVGKYFDVQLNKIAMDFGNFAKRGKFAAKGKAGKAKKHRKQIVWLAEKYDFEADLTLPEKGLADTTPLLRVGAVCCDCGTPPEKCPGRPGLTLKLVRRGAEVPIEQDVRKIPETIKAVLEAMGYARPGEKLPEVFGVSENEEEL